MERKRERERELMNSIECSCDSRVGRVEKKRIQSEMVSICNDWTEHSIGLTYSFNEKSFSRLSDMNRKNHHSVFINC